MKQFNSINPASGQIIASYPLMQAKDIELIINKVSITQQQWARTDSSLRQDKIQQLGQLLRSKKSQIAALITNEMGKPISQAEAEVEKCATLCDYYASEGSRLLQPELIQTQFYKSYRCFQPLGIIFAIMPWNFPIWQVLRFAVPNLMVGNAGLLKHAPNCIGTALAIEQLLVEAGFPENVFRSLVIDLDQVPKIIHHPQVAGVTLTGSNRAGKSVAQEAGAALKKLVLELGGSDPYIILEDADLQLAAEQAVKSRLNNCGQVCIAAKRILVVETVKKEFEQLVLEKAKNYQMGDPLDPNTLLGPMAREDLRSNLDDQVHRTIKAGAHCVMGGKIPASKGYYYPATVLLDVPFDSPAFSEELFGPVVCLSAVKDEQQAIELANRSEFGLSAAVFTRDLQRGERLARDFIQVGTCAVNTLVASDPRLPFGGIKQSGYGRELSLEGMREFVNIKTITIAS